MKKQLHYRPSHTRVLHRALGRIIRGLGDDGTWTDPEAAALLSDNELELWRFYRWLGTATSGHGLTSEEEGAFKARSELGVRLTTDRHGALVLRVPRKSR